MELSSEFSNEELEKEELIIERFYLDDNQHHSKSFDSVRLVSSSKDSPPKEQKKNDLNINSFEFINDSEGEALLAKIRIALSSKDEKIMDFYKTTYLPLKKANLYPNELKIFEEGLQEIITTL